MNIKYDILFNFICLFKLLYTYLSRTKVANRIVYPF